MINANNEKCEHEWVDYNVTPTDNDGERVFITTTYMTRSVCSKCGINREEYEWELREVEATAKYGSRKLRLQKAKDLIAEYNIIDEIDFEDEY